MSEPIRDLAEFAADCRWDELAKGADFTLIDRHMLRELHTLGRIAVAVLNASLSDEVSRAVEVGGGNRSSCTETARNGPVALPETNSLPVGKEDQ